MERTESIVIQAAPEYENEQIKEMESFGWNLQNRQEIHEEGEAYGRPSFIDSSVYIIKVKVSNYVKLHFARSLNLPNLDKIRELENEYNNVNWPDFPKKLPGGGCLLLFWYPFWPFYYFFFYRPKKAKAEVQLGEIVRKRQEILQKVSEYL